MERIVNGTVRMRALRMYVRIIAAVFAAGTFSPGAGAAGGDGAYDFSIGAGMIGSGELDMDFDPYVTKKNRSFAFKAAFDSYVVPKFATGLYMNVATAPVNLHYTDIEYDMVYTGTEWVDVEREVEYSHTIGTLVWEIGASIKTRYAIGEKWAVKPGLSVGYRKFYFNEDDLERADVLMWFEHEDQEPEAAGMGMNGSLEVRYRYSGKLSLFGEAGFLSQPYGGTTHVTDLQFAPIMYFILGAGL